MALITCSYFYRDEAYRTRILLAIIDHNFHRDRVQHKGLVTNEYQYRRVFRKSSKKWDAIPVLEKKTYAYMVPLCASVLDMYQRFEGKLTNSITKHDKHPELISSTIAGIEPPPTASIIKNKHSRFT